MNARLPLRAVPADQNSLPPCDRDSVRFRVTVEGVTLDTLIHYDDNFGISVAAIWHRGVNIAPLLETEIDGPILKAFEEDRKAQNEDNEVERRVGFSG